MSCLFLQTSTRLEPPSVATPRGFAPSLSARRRFAFEGAAAVRAVAIACAMRHHSVEDNVALAREAGRFAGRGLVGFDLAGDEARYPAAPQRHAFMAARAAGLRLTCHAGEAGEPASVEEALNLGIERIAHGVIGAREPRILERVPAEGATLDLRPTAN